MSKEEYINELSIRETRELAEEVYHFAQVSMELKIHHQKFIKWLKEKIEHKDIEQETEYGHARDIGYYFALTDILEKYEEISK